jgi:hypothetical protein
MPTIHREWGFEFRIYTNDHEPAHVHVVDADGVVIVELSAPPSVRQVKGAVKDRRIVQAVRIVVGKGKDFLEQWRKIHGH